MKEVKCWAIGTGRLNPMLKKSRKAVEFIKKLEGFVGVHIIKDGRCAWLFDTENHAKVARNMMEREGIVCGRNISECFVEEQYLNNNG